MAIPMNIPPPPPAVYRDSSLKALNKQEIRKRDHARDINWIAGEFRKSIGRLEDRIETTLEVFGARLENLEFQSRIAQRSQAAMYETHIHSDTAEPGLILLETTANNAYFEWNVDMPEFLPTSYWEVLQQDRTKNHRESKDSAATVIAAHWRGHTTRKRLKEVKAMTHADQDSWHLAQIHELQTLRTNIMANKSMIISPKDPDRCRFITVINQVFRSQIEGSKSEP